MLESIVFQDNVLKLLDQRQLPTVNTWLECESSDEVAKAIEAMVVRGAPAIATAACYGLVLDAARHLKISSSWKSFRADFAASMVRLQATRPTAVNLANALQQVESLSASFSDDLSMQEVYKSLLGFADRLARVDLETCQAIGEHGASIFERPINVLTHCNTGSLATAGYGTALGVIRSLYKAGKIKQVYVDETRPYLQGSRLTAYELDFEGIPYTIQVDSAAAFAMKKGLIDMVVVGADRVVSNGDVANKIGTYSLAVACHYHRVPFYVAAPVSTFDFQMASGADIPIEMRTSDEITRLGERWLSPLSATTWNPSFDVTPSELITGIICEKGVLKPPFSESIRKLL